MSTERRILLGRVAGAFGVRGELKLLSWTDPRDALFKYQPWILRAGESEREVSGVRGRDTGKLVVASFPGVDTRELAEAMNGTEIWVPRDRLPPPSPGEYYWVDLEGLAVETVEGVPLGTVSHLFNTGANLRVPLVAVILRKAYGLGAQAMAGGGLHEPLLTVGWPTAELGAMGLEGAVRLGLRRELEAIDDPEERERRVREVTGHAHEHAKALNAATIFELDDVVDPVETRRLVAATLAAAPVPGPPSRRPVDTW